MLYSLSGIGGYVVSAVVNSGEEQTEEQPENTEQVSAGSYFDSRHGLLYLYEVEVYGPDEEPPPEGTPLRAYDVTMKERGFDELRGHLCGTGNRTS